MDSGSPVGMEENGYDINSESFSTHPSKRQGETDVESSVQSLEVTIDGKGAYLSFDQDLFWLNRQEAIGRAEGGGGKVGERGEGGASIKNDPSRSYLIIPHALVLYSNFVADSDGGSLLVRLLAPPLSDRSSSSSSYTPFKKGKSRSEKMVELQRSVNAQRGEDGKPLSPSRKLQSYLEGPCENLRLVKMEARVVTRAKSELSNKRDGDAPDSDTSLDASRWASKLMSLAYASEKPFRRLKVLVNPVGGPGKALSLFTSRVRPVLEAAGCALDVVITTHVNHGLEIARDELDINQFDSVVCVSGDGMLHEVLNGLAKRQDAKKALEMPLAPVPTGSGNAVALNLVGVSQGFNLALACLNAIKGMPLPLDVCSVTQPAESPLSFSSSLPAPSSSSPSSSSSPPPSSAAPLSTDAHPLPSSSSKAAYTLHYSFLSQAIGLMADVDLGTEDMRALGDARFVIGYIQGVMANKECEVDIDVKFGPKASLDKVEMRRRVLEANHEADVSHSRQERQDAAQEGEEPEQTASPSNRNGEGGPLGPLLHGAVTEPLPLGEGVKQPPTLDLSDPSAPQPFPSPSPSTSTSPTNSTEPGWYRIQAPISALYAGKIPYVARDLLQFPFSLPADGCVDVALTLHRGGRAGKLRAINGAESGMVVYDPALVYMKVEAYRVTPKLPPGHKKLKKGGLVSIDGEHRPYRPFQVEVANDVKMRVLSLYGKWVVPDVPPPSSSSSSSGGKNK